ncbi:hypothetical protein FHT40_003831 [Mycolicibacterium sp. BK556]|uniref:hypothetical protein n=1 Tax=Mycobacteriaceae TaxID=1762 RepID=UPI00105B261B|nr:hypothetical protein [Mycobacterium sp. BK086]MBB3604170.1 hypothetical protein [Mycolicibacterium sp. BK556]MBB3634366.1 hypothetical protein [Mycolicibacterium sp. BK607]MBB3751946.1 hypothetical protein [Mycolicibacterium sp. BK634]TDO12460.1 hypothetical protein EV580_4187 [Mycobacterium sp. BK086]
MSDGIATAPRKNRKLDQWIAFWSVPFFFNLFGIVFVPLSWMMPPRSPSASTSQIVDFMQSHNLLIACAILTLSFGLAPVSNAVYLIQVKRMSVSPVFRYSIMVGSMTGAIVGMLFPMFCFGLGAFRSGYSASTLEMLYDFGYLAYIGSLGCFCVMWMSFGLAILLDQNNILPKWLGYYTIWQYVTELIAAPVWIAKSGPFAWNGLMTFWFAMVLYVSWQIIVYVCIYRSIKKQPDEELENAWPDADSATTDPRLKATA